MTSPKLRFERPIGARVALTAHLRHLRRIAEGDGREDTWMRRVLWTVLTAELGANDVPMVSRRGHPNGMTVREGLRFTDKGFAMTQAISNVWLYSDNQASMEAATAVAVAVSKGHDAALTLLNVVVDTSTDPFLGTPVGQQLMGFVREAKEHRLRALEEEARRELPEGRVRSMLLEGEVAWHTVASHAMKHLPDLVVVPADGGASVGPFGTFSQHLFRKCPAPVWSVQATPRGFPKRALVAVDSGMDGSDERLLSRELLRVAIDLSLHTGMELHVADAWNPWNEGLISARLGADGMRKYLDMQRGYIRDCTEELLRQTGCHERIVAVHYPKGDPGKAIPQLAEEIGADVVILGSGARRGLAGFLMGSVAETILSRLGRSVLVIKRPGFISPVRAD